MGAFTITLNKADDRTMLESAIYNIVLDNVTGDEKLGVKVEYDEFAYKGGTLEIGQRCVAPLYN